MRPSSVIMPNGTETLSTLRISLSTTFDSDEQPAIMRRMSSRMEAISGLSVATAEPFQVVKYGLGGRFSWHYDLGSYLETTDEHETSDVFRPQYGNRIATWLNYMNDVGAGMRECMGWRLGGGVILK